MRKSLVLALVGAIAATFGACHHGTDGTTGPGGGGGVTVSLTAFSNAVGVGQTDQLTAIAKDQNNVVLVRAFTFTTSDPTIATVNANGVVTGVAPGTVWVKAATTDPASDSTSIVVSNLAVNSVLVAPPTANVAVGGTLQLVATLKASDGTVLTGRTITWQSDNTAAATVNSSTGLVTGVAGGQANITATSETKTGTSVITVSTVPVATVSVTSPNGTLYYLHTVQLTITPKDASGNSLAGRSCTVQTSDAAKATVSSSGLVTGGSVSGPVTITATCEGVAGSTVITLAQAPVSSVTVTPPNPSILVAGTTTLTATMKDDLGNVLTGRAVSWGTDNAPVATVNSNTGVVTGVSAGVANISATSEGKTGSTQVTVGNVPIDHITVTLSASNIIAPATSQATATAFDVSNHVLLGRTITFASSNTAAATINSATGLATGVGAGTTNITASGEGKTSPAAVLTVQAAASTVTVTCDTPIAVGQPGATCVAVVKDGGGNILSGRTVAWTSSNHNAATIAGSGNTGALTAVGVGTTNIVATVEGHASTAVTVTVNLAPVASVTLTPPSATLSEGQSTPLTVVLKDQWGNVLTGRAVTSSSSSPSNVSITGSYNANALAAGASCSNATSNLTFTATNAEVGGPPVTSNTSVITVRPAVSTIGVSPTSATVYVNGDLQLIVTLKDACGNVLNNSQRTITYVSADPSKATVSGTGLVHGVQQTATGSPTSITITSEGQSVNVPLTVFAPVATVLISPLDSHISIGGGVDLFVTLKDAQGNVLDNTTRTITYSLSVNGVVTVAATGSAAPYFHVTGVGNGDVTITISSEGISNTTAVHIP